MNFESTLFIRLLYDGARDPEEKVIAEKKQALRKAFEDKEVIGFQYGKQDPMELRNGDVLFPAPLFEKIHWFGSVLPLSEIEELNKKHRMPGMKKFIKKMNDDGIYYAILPRGSVILRPLEKDQIVYDPNDCTTVFDPSQRKGRPAHTIHVASL